MVNDNYKCMMQCTRALYQLQERNPKHNSIVQKSKKMDAIMHPFFNKTNNYATFELLSRFISFVFSINSKILDSLSGVYEP